MQLYSLTFDHNKHCVNQDFIGITGLIKLWVIHMHGKVDENMKRLSSLLISISVVSISSAFADQTFKALSKNCVDTITNTLIAEIAPSAHCIKTEVKDISHP